MTPLKVPVCPVAKSFATMLNPKSAFPVQRPLVKVSVPSLNSELGSRLARGAELKDQVVWRKGVHSELQLIDRVLRWVCAERNIGNSLCDIATDVRAGGDWRWWRSDYSTSIGWAHVKKRLTLPQDVSRKTGDSAGNPDFVSPCVSRA